MPKIAFLVAAEGIERVELTEPWKAVKDAGHEPVLLSPGTSLSTSNAVFTSCTSTKTS